MSIEQFAQDISNSSFLSILMDGSTIHGKEKEAVYIQFVQKDKFLKGGDLRLRECLQMRMN